MALFTTFYQAYIQRVHNEKSVKPICQIFLSDRKNYIHIYVQNNGIGTMHVKWLTFTKDSIYYDKISNCLDLDPTSYWHNAIYETVKKVILPTTNLVVFEKDVENLSDDEIDSIKKQLATITLKVNYQDIYDNNCYFERNLDWFSRHMPDEAK